MKRKEIVHKVIENTVNDWLKLQLDRAREEGKRLGALGELELMYKYVSTTSNGGRKHLLKKIKERLIEFEEVKE